MATDSPKSSTLAWRVFAAGVVVLVTTIAAVLAIGWLILQALNTAVAPQPASAALWSALRSLAWVEAASSWPAWLLLLAGLLLLAWLLARWAVHPLRALVRAVSAQDDAAARLPVRARDETGELARSYQALQDDLHRASTTLEQQRRESHETLERLTTLARIGQEMNGVLELEPLLRQVAAALQTTLGYERAAAAAPDDGWLTLYTGGRRHGESFAPPIRLEQSARHVVGRVALSGQPLRVDDLWAVDSPAPAPLLAEARSELGVPVVNGRETVAVLLLQSARSSAFGARDEQDLTFVAGQLSAALSSVGRFRSELARRRLAEAIHRISKTIGVALSPEGVPQLILDQLAQVVPHDRSALLLLDGDRADVAAARGLGNGHGVARPRLSIVESPLLEQMAAEGRALALPDARGDARYRPLPGAGPGRSWLGAPLLRQGRAVGALVLECDQPDRYRDEEVAAISAIAGQAAIALENARLSAEAEELSRQLEVVTNVTQLVNTRDVSRELPALMRTIVHQIRLVVPCDYAAVALYDEGEDSFSVDTVYDYAVRDWAELPPPQRTSADQTPWQTACRTGSPLVQTALERSAFAYDQALAESGLRSGVVVPITGGSRTLGALSFASRQPAVYGQPQVTTLLEIARQLGTMIHKDRLAREREEAAIELARSREHLNMVDKVRLVGQLASGVAHDFNNLLAGILGNAQLLLLEVRDEEQRDMLKVIERAAKDGTETVRRIQGFARMQPDEQMSEVQLDMLARDAIDLTRPRWRDVAQSRGARIEIERRIRSVAAIFGRAGELREVLSNLIINAADAIQRSGTITVSAYNEPDGAEDAAAEAVVVEVSDTGSGIPPEVHARIFEPFFTTKGEKGTGLGLSVSLGIVQSHGGALSVESEVGVGTRFTIRIPVHPSEQPAAQPSRRHPAHVIPGHILFVGGEAMLRVPTTRLMKYWGHRVTEATTGADAIERFAPETFDVVIVDFTLPDTSAWELLSEIKLRDPKVPIILLSGWGRQTSDEARERGADFVLEKPFDQDDLRAVIAEAMAPRS